MQGSLWKTLLMVLDIFPKNNGKSLERFSTEATWSTLQYLWVQCRERARAGMATYLGTDTNNPIEKQQCPKLGCAQWGCKEVAGFKKCLQDRIKKIWWLIGCGDQ